MNKRSPSLFDGLDVAIDHEWRPEAPPELRVHGITEIELDFETDGLRWWAGHLPVGAAYCLPNGKTGYLPWGHRGGGNLDEAVVRRWFKQELIGVKINNLNSRFDNHMAYAWGADLESQGCMWGDAGHWAALLDDHRQDFSLNGISMEWLGYGKLGSDLDKTQMASYHAGQVAAYAERDVKLVHELKKLMWPQLTEQDLHRVRELEEQVIFVVCEMERNGARLDLNLLYEWEARINKEIDELTWFLIRELKLKADFNPAQRKWKIEVFRRLGVPLHFELDEFGEEKEQPTFTDEVLKKHQDIPAMRAFRRVQRLLSLKAKFILGDQKKLSGDGLLRYALHQLKAVKTEGDDDARGTVSGRFSSTAIMDDEGVNIQQRIKVAKQRTAFGFDEDDASHDDECYIIRKLHIPDDGMEFLSADAMQIEYRLFGNYAKSERIFKIYDENPLTSYHRMMHNLLKDHADLTYRQQKDLNFAVQYAAGLVKTALMLGHITKAQFQEIKQLESKLQWRDPRVAPAREVRKIYDREVPEVKQMLAKASGLAKDRGYVKTVLGRRMRFPGGHRLHKALNGVIQGTAADIMKMKLVELHRERKHTQFKMRWTVHDEVDGDVPDTEHAERVNEILNIQSLKFRIPILWEVSTGPNWADQNNLPNRGPLQREKGDFDKAHQIEPDRGDIAKRRQAEEHPNG